MKKIKIIIACVAIIATYLSVNAFVSGPNAVLAPPSVPVLQLPVDNATGVSLTPKLQVQNSTGGTGTRLYRFQLDLNSGNFSSPIIDVSGISEGTSTTMYIVPSGNLSNSTIYKWRVECYTAEDGSSGFQNPFHFTTQ